MKKSLLCLLLAALVPLSCACASADDKPEYASKEIEFEDLLKLNTGKKSGYLCELTGNAKKDAEIWAWADELYIEWRERYDLILAKGNAQVTSPVTQKSRADFTDSIYMEFSNRKGTEATRTMATLSAYKAATAEEDEYGGWVNESMKQEAKGYFYTKKIKGRWYFIDPNGYPTILRGVAGMTHIYAGSNYQKEVTIDKYGSPEKWAIAATRQLDDLHINARSVIDVADPYLQAVQNKVPYQDKISPISTYERKIGGYDTDAKSGSTILLYGMHVFDPEFETFTAEYVKEEMEKDGYCGDPYFIGYATDNEIPVGENMLTEFLSLDIRTVDINYYSYAAAWTFLAKESGKNDPTPLDANKSQYKDLFRAFVYDRYFAVVVPAIRAVDENVLILGTRALNAQRDSEGINRVSGHWCDVLSYNWYKDWTPDATQLDNISKWSGKPIIITEFYAKASEGDPTYPVTLPNTLSTTSPLVATQAERGKFYQNYCLRLLECRSVAGWYWFMYIEATPGDGTSTYMNDNTNNTGLYSNNHNLYTDFAKYVSELNGNAYSLTQYFDK